MAQTKAEKNQKARDKRAAKKAVREYKAREWAVYSRWEDLETRGLVRWACEAECEALENFEPDFEHCRDEDQTPEEAKAEWYRSIERDGIWMYATEYRINAVTPWQSADSIGGVEGSIRGSGYDLDLMNAAFDALDAAYQAEADALDARATFASASA